MKPARLALGLLVAAAVAAGAYWSLDHTADTAPEVSVTRLDGSILSLSSLRGQVVLVNFWATSCSTCVKEMPELVQTHERFHPRGLRTLAIAMSYDPPAYVVNFTQTRRLPFDVAIDHDGRLAQGFGNVQATPTTFVIDKQGRIAKRYVGPPDFGELQRLIERLIDG